MISFPHHKSHIYTELLYSIVEYSYQNIEPSKQDVCLVFHLELMKATTALGASIESHHQVIFDRRAIPHNAYANIIIIVKRNSIIHNREFYAKHKSQAQTHPKFYLLN